MANIFAITTASDTIKLNEQRHGEVVFTVTDTVARPLRGLAKLKALGDTKQQWLRLAGESERDFAAGGTQQFTVMLDIPPGAPPGKYGFRLDVVSSINPDEDFTEGPTVTAELLPAKPPAPSKAWVIPVALIVLVLIVVAIVLIVTRNKKVKVPPVEGQKIEQARDSLTKAQLKFNEEQVPAIDPTQVGTVKSALPKPGEGVDPGSTVALQVYVPGKVVVRKVLGSTLEQAKVVLEREQFLKVTVADQPVASLTYHAGQVAEQNPGEGTQVEAGSPVNLTLAGSTGRVPLGMVGRGLQNAMQLIVTAKLNLNPVVGEKLDGPVVRVEPAETTPVLEGTKVTLYVLRAPCVTPLCLELRDRMNRAAGNLLQPLPSP